LRSPAMNSSATVRLRSKKASPTAAVAAAPAGVEVEVDGSSATGRPPRPLPPVVLGGRTLGEVVALQQLEGVRRRARAESGELGAANVSPSSGGRSSVGCRYGVGEQRWIVSGSVWSASSPAVLGEQAGSLGGAFRHEGLPVLR
jgi:hypothetical protein